MLRNLRTTYLSARRRRQFFNHFQAARWLPCSGLGRARRSNPKKMEMQLMLFDRAATKILLIFC